MSKLPTSVRVITPENGCATGTRVFNPATGEEIRGVERIAIPVFSSGDLVKVELTLAFAVIKVDGRAIYQIFDPETGGFRHIRRVEFADGTVLEAE